MLGRTYGRYRTVAPIGEGGMATVWRAVDPLLERDVALKLLSPPLARSPEARRRFRREADVAQLLDHPAIAPVFDSGETDTDAWLAMALVDGETLAQRMGRGLVPVNECVDVAAILASALGYAHARGVLHRDLSTRNVMLARDGRVFLLDFGLAKLEGASSLTRSAGVPGTLLYMAPEVLCGGAADPRSDLYSLSAVLYELVTGTPPHHDDAPESLIYAKLNTTPRPANELRPDAPPALVHLLARTLARDPAARPADAEEFLGELKGPHGPEPTEPSGARSAGELLAEGHSVIYLGVPPFEVPVADQSQLGELATSLADALRRRLGSLRRLHVLQVRAPLEPDGDVLKWATLHGANLVIVGRLGRRGAHARVECTLFDPVGHVSLAGETVEGSWFDAFDLEDRLVACARRLLPVLHDDLAEPNAQPTPAAADDDRLAQARRYLQRHDHEPSVDAAMGLLERLAAARPERAEFHAALAHAYLAKHALTRQRAWEERAASSVHRARELEPGSPEVQLAIAELKAATGHGAEAAELFRSALEQDPERFDGWLGLARLPATHAEFEQAEAACRRAIALRPRDWRGYSTLGTIYYRQGRYAQAVPPWRRVLRLSPEHARAASNMAVALYQLDRVEESEVMFRRSLALEPNAATYANLGTCLYAQHRFKEALAALERACELRQADARFWGYLGAAARQVAGAEERSRRAFERAIGLMRESLDRNPEDGESWAIFAAWLAAQGQGAEARDAITRALALAPRDVRCMTEAVHTFTLLGEQDRALDFLEQALAAGYGTREVERSIELQPLRGHERYRNLLARAAEFRGEIPRAPSGG